MCSGKKKKVMFKNPIKNNIIFQKGPKRPILSERIHDYNNQNWRCRHTCQLSQFTRPLDKNKWIRNYTTFRYHLDIIFKEEKLSYVYIYLKQCQIVPHWLDSWIPKNFKTKSLSLLFGSPNLPDNSNLGSFFQKKMIIIK